MKLPITIEAMPPAGTEKIWKGEASTPAELADEIEAAVSQAHRMPGVEPIEAVCITISAANRELLVKSLRAYRAN